MSTNTRAVPAAQHSIGLRIDAVHLASLCRSPLASAQDRLAGWLHLAECDVILGVVRAGSVHKIGYGHNGDWASA